MRRLSPAFLMPLLASAVLPAITLVARTATFTWASPAHRELLARARRRNAARSRNALEALRRRFGPWSAGDLAALEAADAKRQRRRARNLRVVVVGGMQAFV